MASSQVVLTLEDELNYLVSCFRDEIEILEAALDREQLHLNSKVDIPSFTEQHDASTAPRDSVFSRIDGDMIGQGFKSLSGAAKPEHIMSALESGEVLLGVLLGRDERVRVVYGLLAGAFYMNKSAGC